MLSQHFNVVGVLLIALLQHADFVHALHELVSERHNLVGFGALCTRTKRSSMTVLSGELRGESA